MLRLPSLFSIPPLCVLFALHVPSHGQVTSVTPLFDVRQQSDIVYGSYNSTDLLLDIYAPTAPGPHPAILWLHSGPDTSGRKEQMAGFAREYASRGFFSTAVNYRDRDHEHVGEAVVAATTAMGWLRDNAEIHNVDTTRIAVGGYLMGASVALHLGYRELGPVAEVGAILAIQDASSGVETEIDASDPPALLLHGDEDPFHPVEPTETIYERAKELGISSEFYRLEGLGFRLREHFESEVGGRSTLELGAEFLNKHLNVAELERVQGRRSEVVAAGSEWSYFVGHREPSPYPELNWATSDFNDATWSVGRDGFGFGRLVEERGVLTQVDFTDQATALYVRRDFSLESPDRISGLVLELDYDDGFIAYVNGQEVTRSNVTDEGPIPIVGERRALRQETHTVQHYIDVTSFPGLLAEDNVLAIQGLNSRVGDRDFVLSGVSLSTVVVPETATNVSTLVLCLTLGLRRRHCVSLS